MAEGGGRRAMPEGDTRHLWRIGRAEFLKMSRLRHVQ